MSNRSGKPLMEAARVSKRPRLSAQTRELSNSSPLPPNTQLNASASTPSQGQTYLPDSIGKREGTLWQQARAQSRGYRSRTRQEAQNVDNNSRSNAPNGKLPRASRQLKGEGRIFDEALPHQSSDHSHTQRVQRSTSLNDQEMLDVSDSVESAEELSQVVRGRIDGEESVDRFTNNEAQHESQSAPIHDTGADSQEIRTIISHRYQDEPARMDTSLRPRSERSRGLGHESTVKQTTPSKKRSRQTKVAANLRANASTTCNTDGSVMNGALVHSAEAEYIRSSIRLAETYEEMTSASALREQPLHHMQGFPGSEITSKVPVRLVSLDNEYAQVSSLLSRTITSGESNSMLLIGSRGSGKSSLVHQAIKKQMSDHSNEFQVVRLNGFIHTDDRIALREIWQQLRQKADIRTAARSHADTLTTLLALLSHPTELDVVASAPDHMAKSVIFVLDEFERFASHPRQTLLYNLFDIAQSRKAPIAVLGLTTRVDVAESLEKRVKSRFSHRYVHLGQPSNVQTFEAGCKSALALSLEILHDEAADYESLAINDIMANEAISSHLHQLYYATRSVPAFLASIAAPLANMQPGAKNFDSCFSPLTFASQLRSGVVDSKLSLLGSLSNLQLALLVCATRLCTIYDMEVISLNLAYEEYKTLASKVKLQTSTASALGVRVWSKDIARGAWRGLVESEFIIEDRRSAGDSFKVDVSLEELSMSGINLGMWARYCSEI